MKGFLIFFYFLYFIKKFRDVKSETDLEQLISLVLTIGLEELDLDDINSILSTLLKYIKNNTNEVVFYKIFQNKCYFFLVSFSFIIKLCQKNFGIYGF